MSTCIGHDWWCTSMWLICYNTSLYISLSKEDAVNHKVSRNIVLKFFTTVAAHILAWGVPVPFQPAVYRPFILTVIACSGSRLTVLTFIMGCVLRKFAWSTVFLSPLQSVWSSWLSWQVWVSVNSRVVVLFSWVVSFAKTRQ